MADKFTANPCKETFDQIENKKAAIRKLNKPLKYYFRWLNGDTRITRLQILSGAIEFGYDQIFFDVITDDELKWELGYNAVCFGRREIVKYFLDRGIQNWKGRLPSRDYTLLLNILALVAAGKAYNDIVSDLIEVGADDWNTIAKKAAEVGNAELVDLMFDIGADDFNGIAREAVKGGFTHLVLDIYERENPDNDVVLSERLYTFLFSN